MTLHRFAIALGLTILMTASSWAAPVKTLTVTEEFDGTIDEASWRSDPSDVIVPTGGNPGGYLEADVVAFEPEIASTTPPFATTSYRNLGVTALGIDIDLLDTPSFTEGRPLSLHLMHNNRTPDDPSDDCELVFVGKSLPSKPDAGWVSYDFRVPARSDHLPSGWDVYGACAADPPDSAWLRVIGSVSRVSFHFGEPGVRYYPGRWIVGFDNARITYGKGGTPPA